MDNNTSSEVYYFGQETDNNVWQVTVADSQNDEFSVVKEFTIDELSAITVAENEGGNGEGAAWGDAIVSDDGSRIFANARNADKVVVIDTATQEVEEILDVGDRPVHSFLVEDELWVHVDGDGAFNVIDTETLEVSELIDTNTVGSGHGKLLLAEGLGDNTYVTNTEEPAVFPIDLETREVSPPIEIGGGDLELGTHDKGYDPGTGLAFFQLTNDAGYSFIDAETNEVVLDQVPIFGRVAHTPDEQFILILNAEAEENDIGIWNTSLDTHTQPEFDAEVTIGGEVSVNGTEFYLDNGEWEAWIPQTEGDNVAVLNLSSNEVDYIEVGNLTAPSGAGHFSRIGEIDDDYFYTYSDEGAKKIDLDTHEVSDAAPLDIGTSRIAVVETEESQPNTDTTLEPLFGTVEADTIEIEGDNRLVFAGDSNDLIDASIHSQGNNRIYAGSGDDTLILGTKDFLVGDLGSDKPNGMAESEGLRPWESFRASQTQRFFAGSGGDNTITGGANSDQFWIASAEIPESANVITDFNSGEDVIGIAGLGIGFDNLTITQQGDNALIAVEGDELAILQGIDSNSLVADDFAFA